MPRILDDLNEDPAFQALSPAAKAAVKMAAAKRPPLMTPQAADPLPGPRARTRSVVERAPAPDPLDPYIAPAPRRPVPKAISQRRAQAQPAASMLDEFKAMAPEFPGETDADRAALDAHLSRPITNPLQRAVRSAREAFPEEVEQGLSGAMVAAAYRNSKPADAPLVHRPQPVMKPLASMDAQDPEPWLAHLPAPATAPALKPGAPRPLPPDPRLAPKTAAELPEPGFFERIGNAAGDVADENVVGRLHPMAEGFAEGAGAGAVNVGVNVFDPAADILGAGALNVAGKAARRIAGKPPARPQAPSITLDDGTVTPPAPRPPSPDEEQALGDTLARLARMKPDAPGPTDPEAIMAARRGLMDSSARRLDTAKAATAKPADPTPLTPDRHATDDNLSLRIQGMVDEGRAAAQPRRPIPSYARRAPQPRTPQVDTPPVIAAGPIKRPLDYRTDAEGINGKTWYHGTGAEGLTGGELSPAQTKAEGLFGMGIYLTDNPDIAGGYAVARGKRSKPNIYEAGVKVNRVLDLEKPVAQDFLDVLKERAAWLAGGGDEDLVKALDAAASRPGATNEELYQTFSQGVEYFSHSNMISSNELYDDFLSLNEGLRARGYDAYTHVGGKRHKRDPHQVLIMLDPNGEFQHIKPGDSRPPSQMTKFQPWSGEDPAVVPDAPWYHPQARAGAIFPGRGGKDGKRPVHPAVSRMFQSADQAGKNPGMSDDLPNLHEDMINIAIRSAEEGVPQAEAYARWNRIREGRGDPMPKDEPSAFARVYQHTLNQPPGKASVGPAPEGYVRPRADPAMFEDLDRTGGNGFTWRDFVDDADEAAFRSGVNRMIKGAGLSKDNAETLMVRAWQVSGEGHAADPHDVAEAILGLAKAGVPTPWENKPLLARMLDHIQDGASSTEAAQLATKKRGEIAPFKRPTLKDMLTEEDGVWRPGKIGEFLGRMLGRDRSPVPAPSAAVGVARPADGAADAGLTFDNLPARRASVPLDEIHLDPQTYQFKGQDRVTGKNGRFDGEDTWRPDNLTQKPIIVHQRADGRLYVADGHQRVNLARELAARGQNIPPLNALVLDARDGWTPELVMRKASLMNIDEGTGTALDVARLIGRGGMSPEQIQGLAKSSAAVRDGRTLATLNDEALTFIANQDIKPSVAAEAAKATDDPALRMTILREMADDKPATAGEAALLARDVIETGISQGAPANQLAMFDLKEYSKSNRKTLYRIVNALKTALKGDESLGKLLTARADEIRRIEGNTLNEEANTLLKTEAGALQFMLEREAGAVGPFRDALKALATEVDSGKRTLQDAVVRGREALGEAGVPQRDVLRGDPQPGVVRPASGMDAPGGMAVNPGPLPDVDLFGNPVGPTQPVAPAVPAITPPASIPEAGGPLEARPRTTLDRPAPPADAKALDGYYRMRDRFAASGNARGLSDFQERIDAIEAKYVGPPDPKTAQQLQGRLNMLKRHLREARIANNQERAGELSSQIDEIDALLTNRKPPAAREPNTPLEQRSPVARENQREALTDAYYAADPADVPEALARARRSDDGVHKRMHNLPSDPNDIVASVFENFRVHGGSPEESEILQQAVQRVMSRSDWNPHARVPVADVLDEAAATDPALVEELIRRGVPKDQMIPMQMQAAIKQRQVQIERMIADVRKDEEAAILSHDLEAAQMAGNMIQRLERDLDAALEITVPMGSKYARALRMEGVTARREGFDTSFWLARARRNHTGDTMKPAPPKIEKRIKAATEQGGAAKATKADALAELRAMGIDVSALEAPPTVESVMRESGMSRFMGKLKDWGLSGKRPGALWPGRAPGVPAKPNRQPLPLPDLSHLTPEQRARAEALWKQADEARTTERAAQVELVRAAADANMTTFAEAITNTRRAFLIAGVKTFERNILSNLSNIPLEGASHALGAAPDWAMTKLGMGKSPGARTVRVARFDDVAEAVREGVPEGFRQWGEILRNGQTAEDIARQEVVTEQNTGIPAWDAVVNIVFRNQAGADRPNYMYGYTRSLQRQARNLFPDDEAARHAFLTNPPEAATNEALADAAWATFQNDTAMNQVLQQIGTTLRRGGPGGRAAAWLYDNLGALYKKTPSAVATRTTVDFTPMGAAFRVLEALHANGVQKLDPANQKAISLAIGRGAVGTGVIAAGWALADQGGMTGYYRPDFKEEILASRRAPGSIYFRGEWIPLQWLGPVGHLLAIGATLREAGAGTVLPFSDASNWPTQIAVGAGAAMQSVVDSPMAQSAKQMGELLQPDDKTAAQKANKLAGNFAQGFVPSLINELARAKDVQDDGYGRRRAVDDTTLAGAVGDSLKSRVPGLREALPIEIDDLGNEVREPGGWNAFNAAAGNPAEETRNAAVRAIIQTGADLRSATSTIRDTGGRGRADDVSLKLAPALERDFRGVRGKAITDEVQKAIQTGAYLQAEGTNDLDAMRGIVQDAIAKGSKVGTKAFRRQGRATLQDLRPGAMLEKERKKDIRSAPVAPWWDEPGATVPPALRGRTASPTP